MKGMERLGIGGRGGFALGSMASTFPSRGKVVVERRYMPVHELDEAHSSQTGKSSEKLREILADISAKGEEFIQEKLHAFAEYEAKIEKDAEEEEMDEAISNELKTHGHQPNLEFFAFTATPKQKTLEIFGKRNEEGKPCPFDVYSMKQAIEEGFIFDVLQNYTTYQTYFQLGKKVIDYPNYETSKDNKALER